MHSGQRQDISQPSVNHRELTQENTETSRISAKCSQKVVLSKFVLHEHCELSHKVVTQIACGESHATALTEDGRIYNFHTGCRGQSGDVLLGKTGLFECFDLDKSEDYDVHENCLWRATHSCSE